MPQPGATPPTFPSTPSSLSQFLLQFFLQALQGLLGGGGSGGLFAPLLDVDGEFPGGGFGVGRELPPANQTRKLELLTAALDRPVPLAYGRHIVGGNVIFEKENSDGAITLFVALGEGEWEGPERVWVNGLEFDISDTNQFHFHPGLEGQLGVETDPAVRNQKICSFLPTDFAPQLTFARTAYAAFKLRREPTQPGPEFDIRGIYQTTRIRQFDNLGNQTAYSYSFNPAWCALDLLLRRFLLPHGQAGEALLPAVKDRIDFAAWKAWADFCDVDLTINGQTVNRFEAHVAFVDATDLLRALEWLLLQGRGYLLERSAKFAAFADEARSPLLSVGRDDIAADTLRLHQRSLRSSPNQFFFRYRALDSGTGPGTLSSTGTAVTGSGTTFTNFFKAGQSLELLDGPQAGERRTIDSISSDTALTLATAFSADQAGRRYSNPALDFQPQLKEVADEDHQDQVGRIIRAEVDLGNSTGERAERLAEYLKRRTLTLRDQLRCRLLASLNGANDLLPGDLLTAPADLDPAAGGATKNYEILEISDEPDGSREVFALEYSPSVFVDTAGPQQLIVHAPFPGGGFASNAQQMANVLQNGSFFRAGVAGQEGTNRPKFWKEYSNPGGAPGVPADVEHLVADDRIKLKTKTSTVDKIGARTLWNNLGKLFKPGQYLAVAVSVRHTGLSGLYDKAVKFKIDSDAQTYTRADGTKFDATIPAHTLGNRFVIRFAVFQLRSDQAVPDALNLFLWSEATNAAKANEDLEIDFVTLAPGRVWRPYDPADEIRDADITWNVAAGLYDLPAYVVKAATPSSDSGGAGGSSGGGEGSEGGSGGVGPLL